MHEIFQKLVYILTHDATLNAIVPTKNIFVGDFDAIVETQSTLTYPAITMFMVSESFRTVPVVRDTMVQLDIWSFNSQTELNTIYERVATLLNFYSGNQSNAHIFWDKISSSQDLHESDRRIWRRAVTLTVWSIK